MTVNLEVVLLDAMLPYCLEHIGVDAFLFASDYPHWDMNFPHALSGRLKC